MGCGEQQTKIISKKTGTHHIFYCMMAKFRIGMPATTKTELPMTICACFLPINIITNRPTPDTAETLNLTLVITIQNSPTIILLDSGQHPEKKFSWSLVYVIDRGCEASCILIFTVPFDTQYENNFPILCRHLLFDYNTL